MARYKHYDYNQLMIVPVSLEEQLMPGTLEYAIHHVVEERLDLAMFEDRYIKGSSLRLTFAWIEYPGAWYHVMNRGRRGEDIFTE